MDRSIPVRQVVNSNLNRSLEREVAESNISKADNVADNRIELNVRKETKFCSKEALSIFHRQEGDQKQIVLNKLGFKFFVKSSASWHPPDSIQAIHCLHPDQAAS